MRSLMPATSKRSGNTLRNEQISKAREHILLAFGAVSMCWSELPQGTFHSHAAIKIADKLLQEIKDCFPTYSVFAPGDGITYRLCSNGQSWRLLGNHWIEIK